MTKTVMMFPGQGSQQVGMGKTLADESQAAAAVFAEVDEALGQNLSALMFDGPQEDLNISKNTQPALFAHSLAVIRVLEQEFDSPVDEIAMALVGHSLGEYSALTAAGVFSLADAARLLRLRGQAMQRAVPQGEGAMAAILGLEREAVAAIADEASQSDNDLCALANDNCPGQAVVSGHASAVERAMALAKDKGAKRALPLPVSVPSHCVLMRPAADEMRDALESAAMSPPRVPVYANVSAAPEADVDVIKQNSIAQLCATVRFSESIANLAAQGIVRFVEVGTGKTLSGLVKRIVPDAASFSLSGLADIESFVKEQS